MIADHEEWEWWVFSIPRADGTKGAEVAVPALSLELAREVLKRNAYAGAKTETWPLLYTRVASRDAIVATAKKPTPNHYILVRSMPSGLPRTPSDFVRQMEADDRKRAEERRARASSKP